MNKNKLFLRRLKRVRSSLKGNASIPRLSVFRSNKHIYAQVIDDKKGVTVLFENDLKIVKKGENKAKVATKQEVAFQVGEKLAQKSIKKGLARVVFDRGGYKYHGRVKNVAEGARKGGLKF
ncbi:MAG: 50S ribosomal protein L18 [Candidatus Woesebacteria bacterium GW2011_GWA1_39_21]|uniref:Large ribosomal subunit protein uL18 n=1 Tax=Candidatus Woesebacteria bacterium GW2011_GWA1_39_21 TaxID=1618550 RepID=A0A0G0NFM5_9BACT|nr:MAG: 50S ribosomal protein L18 [Candidatus Woesebacteria bacterium GW2011_GWA1_39_21]